VEYERRPQLRIERGDDTNHRAFEAVLLGLLGGAIGVAAGVIGSIVYASARDWAVVVPRSPGLAGWGLR
jgi:ABC-type antimicrobial peptide transport system permease subunit